MRQYKGAVCFLDLLGVGALTQKRIKLRDSDYEAHSSTGKLGIRSEQGFCANLLIKFRKVLLDVASVDRDVQVAQLSDSAFIWSRKPLELLGAVAQCMRAAVKQGLLCRGGIAFGDIIEPDSVNSRIGAFIAGEAATK